MCKQKTTESSAITSYIEMLAIILIFSLPSFIMSFRHHATGFASLDKTDITLVIVAVVAGFLTALIGRGLQTAKKFLQFGVGTAVIWYLYANITNNQNAIAIYVLVTLCAVVLNLHLYPVTLLAHLREKKPDCKIATIMPVVCVIVAIDFTPLVSYYLFPHQALLSSALWLGISTIIGAILSIKIINSVEEEANSE